MSSVERDPDRLFAPAAVSVGRRTDGTVLLSSPQPLKPYSRCVGDWLVDWAGRAPERCFLAERRPDGRWKEVTYGEALDAVMRVGSWLLRQGLSADRPVVILCDNSVEHALLALSAMHVGIPVVPVSSAYALISRDFGKLKTIIETVMPGVIYVAEAARFRTSLEAIAPVHSAAIVACTGHTTIAGAHQWAELLGAREDAAVARAFATVGPDTVAKLLHTSGSTGSPKGVINTQRMLCANQQQILQVWPFTAETPPVIVDWLPWSHTFGGNHNFNFVLRAGGTLYIDAGRAVPGLFEHTVVNLKEISPTIYFNVPRGYDLLVRALRADEALRLSFFSRLQVIFYAAAALPHHVWTALEQLAVETIGEPVVLVSSWGSTETAPLAAACHFRANHAGIVGLPIPGCELKLVPASDKMEVRVRGPNVMPGYWKLPELTAHAFDTEGFYCIGDAMRLVDEAHPEHGLAFDGRVSEDFKLTTGTWVNVGGLRLKAITALEPVAQDIVIAGDGRDTITLLVFPNLANCRHLCRELLPDAEIQQVLANEAVRSRVREGLQRLRRAGIGSSTYASRALLLVEPPSLDAGEITDKGSINQRAVLTLRSAAVEKLYNEATAGDIISIES
jgi:feruloyl-CoA synthase